MAMTVWKKALLESRLGGRDEGRREERSNMLVKLIEKKFGVLSQKLVDRIQHFDEEKVYASIEKLHTVSSLADLKLDQD
jgi:hypothetical protein